MPLSRKMCLLSALLAVFMLALVTSLFPIEDSDDDWWHLKAGKLLWIGQIGWYSPDAFTDTARDKVWVNHEWLAEVLFYVTYLKGGLLGANLAKSLIIALTFLVVFRNSMHLNPHSIRSSFLAVALAIPTSQFTFYLRPPIWTFFFLALYHHLLRSQLQEDRDLSLSQIVRRMMPCAFLMVLWANLHGGAILGCVVVFLMACGCLLDRPYSQSAVISAISLAALVGVASLINPYGFQLHLLTFEVMSEKWLTERIFELAPTRIDLVWSLVPLFILGAWGCYKEGKWGERLVFLFLAWQGLSHIRHLPLLAIWAAPYAARVLAPLLSPLPRASMVLGLIPGALFGASSLLPDFPWGALNDPAIRYFCVGLIALASLWTVLIPNRMAGFALLAVSGLAIGYVVGFPGQRVERFLRVIQGQAWSGRLFPDKLCDFIEEKDLKAPVLFCRETGAGYLIWRLAPERMRVFSCTRFDLQGAEPVKEIESMLWQLPSWTDPDTGRMIPAWDQLWDQKYHFDIVLLEKYSIPDPGNPGSWKIFRLWELLSKPDSGFVRVAGEAIPAIGPKDRQFGLFLRKGDQLSHLMSVLPQPAWFEESTE